ncbi:hypothetical protein [Halobellus captivus]|uniref:hypothetical protein n=1 Tax=Halobellus captivus TaxID=2592614 RepID=UPI001396AD05|nr:hypothetical protein [Halobellus captivus]
MTDHRRQCLRSRTSERAVEQRQHAPADAAPELYEGSDETQHSQQTTRSHAPTEQR